MSQPQLSEVEIKYCSCIIKTSARPIRNPYAICTKSVYGSRGLKRDKVVHCLPYYDFNSYEPRHLLGYAKLKKYKVPQKLQKNPKKAQLVKLLDRKRQQELQKKGIQVVKVVKPGEMRKVAKKLKLGAKPAAKKSTCPVGKELNPKTGRCRVACKPHQFRNPKTGRCNKKSPTAKTPITQPKSTQKRSMTVKQLKDECRRRGIRGYSRLRKAELEKLCLTTPVVAKKTKPGPRTKTFMINMQPALRKLIKQVHPELILDTNAAKMINEMLNKVLMAILHQTTEKPSIQQLEHASRQVLGNTSLALNVMGDALTASVSQIKPKSIEKYINKQGAMYLARLMESLAGELFEIAGNVTLDEGKNRMTPAHVKRALTVDEELGLIF